MLGRYEPALEESRKMVDQDPDFLVGYSPSGAELCAGGADGRGIEDAAGGLGP
jgi:hypothetical protein